MKRLAEAALFMICASAAPLAFAQAQSGDSATTIRANTTLVVVDVVVTDAQQNPVHHLSASDFTVLENGKPQAVKNFEEHSVEAAPAQPAQPKLKLAPGEFTNYSPTPQVGALNVLLFDSLNTPLQAQPYLRDQVLKFIKDARPGVPVAIFGLNTQLRLLQGFTSDPEVLRAAINSRKANAKSSPLMDDPMTGNSIASDAELNEAVDMLGNAPDAAMVAANLQQFQAEQQSFQLQLRARYTLDAMNQLARYLSRLPGRKNLIWFSGSFPINILPDGDLKDPFAVVASSEDEFRETTDLLARSQVAVYPIDARGLMTDPTFDASVSGRGFTKNPGAFAKESSKFYSQTASEHTTMMAMADATGGRAYVNTNGLKDAVEKAIENGSNYYTLTYSPQNQNLNGDYRKIQVKLARQGLNLSYRKGYFADDPAAPVKHGDAPPIAGVAAEPYKAMRAAMLHGAPDPTQILFEALVTPVNGVEEPSVAKGNDANPKLKGPFRRYSVHYIAQPRDVDCPTTPDGIHHCSLEFVTLVYDADGVALISQVNGIRANIPADKYELVRRGGLQFAQEVSVPVKGESFLRIGIHDVTSDRVGAIEIDSVSLAKTPPPPQPSAPAQK